MRQTIAILLMALMAGCMFKYRYRIVNLILRQPLLRRMAIVTVLRLPFIRRRIMGTLFSFPDASQTNNIDKHKL
ncbi:hypothetical protein [Bacillus sp. JCM 19041]|uniref:hypothetical protein n=1 Tax=Bacillus sp. JCM 19041 TaxID=1460637 RepID=UPI0006D0FFAC